MEKKVVFSIRDLTKRFRSLSHPANHQINLNIFEGEIFGILGDNGAGKSTLVKQMAGLIKSDEGTIELFGTRLNSERLQVPLQIGYMPQDGSALNSMTTEEALYFTAHLRGLSRKGAKAERERLIELWGLEEMRHRPASKFSGGENRLLLLATAMAGNPPVLILDEPTNDLAPQRRRQVWRILSELNQTYNTTIVFITHDAIEAERIIQRVGIMRSGQLLAVGAPKDLKNQVDQLVRFEVSFDPANPPTLPPYLSIIKQEEDRWLAYVSRQDVNQVLNQLNMNQVEDFKLYSATLEDLYMYFAHDEEAPILEPKPEGMVRLTGSRVSSEQ